jgi:hypothetical protein
MESEPTQGTCDRCYRLHLLADLIRHDDDLLCPDCRGYVSLVVARGDPAEFSRLLAIEAAARAGSAPLGSRTTGRRRSTAAGAAPPSGTCSCRRIRSCASSARGAATSRGATSRPRSRCRPPRSSARVGAHAHRCRCRCGSCGKLRPGAHHERAVNRAHPNARLAEDKICPPTERNDMHRNTHHE